MISSEDALKYMASQCLGSLFAGLLAFRVLNNHIAVLAPGEKFMHSQMSAVTVEMYVHTRIYVYTCIRMYAYCYGIL
jgi:glycerol uptake facilitator-like aquaporin